MEFNATFFVTAISFLVFTILMDIILYAPISEIVEERQKMIDELINEAGLSREEAEKLLKERDKKLLKSSDESRKIIADMVEKANKRADVLTVNAKNASVEDIALKKDELYKNEAKVRENLNEVTKSLADDIVSRVLR